MYLACLVRRRRLCGLCELRLKLSLALVGQADGGSDELDRACWVGTAEHVCQHLLHGRVVGECRSSVCQLLQMTKPPTAIISLGTSMLAEVLEAITSNGLRYPQDVSIVCSGDTDLARHATPAISALSWDMNEVGRTAARLLLEQIREPDKTGSGAPVFLPTRLILRHSCAAPATPTRGRK